MYKSIIVFWWIFWWFISLTKWCSVWVCLRSILWPQQWCNVTVCDSSLGEEKLEDLLWSSEGNGPLLTEGLILLLFLVNSSFSILSIEWPLDNVQDAFHTNPSLLVTLSPPRMSIGWSGRVQRRWSVCTMPWQSRQQTTLRDHTSSACRPLTGGSSSFRPRESM